MAKVKLNVVVEEDLYESMERVAEELGLSFESVLEAYLREGMNTAEHPLGIYGIRMEAEGLDMLKGRDLG